MIAFILYDELKGDYPIFQYGTYNLTPIISISIYLTFHPS